MVPLAEAGSGRHTRVKTIDPKGILTHSCPAESFGQVLVGRMAARAAAL
jgi:hypothetical protein